MSGEHELSPEALRFRERWNDDEQFHSHVMEDVSRWLDNGAISVVRAFSHSWLLRGC